MELPTVASAKVYGAIGGDGGAERRRDVVRGRGGEPRGLRGDGRAAKLASVDASDVASDLGVTVSKVNGVAVVEYSATVASVDAAGVLAATLESELELTKDTVAEELKEQVGDGLVGRRGGRARGDARVGT